MARLLMNLRDVPADEYEEICTLLDRHALEHYRIEPSRWGLHGGGLWLVDDERFEEARAQLADYQAERVSRARTERQTAQQDGSWPSVLDRFRQQPLRMTALSLALLVVVALSVLPFLWLMGWRPG